MSVNMHKMLNNAELRELQARELYFYKRQNLRDKIRDRTVERLRALTTHSDYRDCVDATAAKRPSSSETAKKIAVNNEGFVDLTFISDDEDFEVIAQGIKKRQRIEKEKAEHDEKDEDIASASLPAAAASPDPNPNPSPFTHFAACRHDHVPPQTPLPDAAPPVATVVSDGIPEYAKVTNMTLTHLIKEMMQDESLMIMDPKECGHPGCAYCTGCIMGQRYALVKRLVQLEHQLYGTYA